MRRSGSLILPRLDLRSPQALQTMGSCDRSGQWSDPDRNWLLRQQAQFAAQRRQYPLALASFDRLLADQPASAVDYNNRGLIHFRTGDRAAALRDFNRAIALNPNLAHAFNNRANCYAAQKDWLRAIVDYQTALALDPHNIRAWLNQGTTYRNLTLFAAAIEHFDRAIVLNQQTTDVAEQVLLAAHLYAARGRTHHLRGDWNCALADYAQALDYLHHESQSTAYPPLWWQVDGWRKQILQPHLNDQTRRSLE